MRPENEGKYGATLVTCFACAEVEKFKIGLADGGETEPGVRISVTKL